LLTARHVVFDKLRAIKEYDEELNRFKRSNYPPTYFELERKKAEARAYNTIFRKIAIVRPLEQIVKNNNLNIKSTMPDVLSR